MRAELSAGATYVIAEAREAGNVGYLPGKRRSPGRVGAGDTYLKYPRKKYSGKLLRRHSSFILSN